jgi:hypothetical protein
MRIRVLSVLALLTALAAGCGGGSGGGGTNAGGGKSAYTASATAPCLKQQGFKDVTTSPNDVGLVAAFADNGGIKATAPDGNTVVIAFAANDVSAADTEAAFRKHAAPRYRHHMADVMTAANNAVIVWGEGPAKQDHDLVVGCLHHG